MQAASREENQEEEEEGEGLQVGMGGVMLLFVCLVSRLKGASVRRT